MHGSWLVSMCPLTELQNMTDIDLGMQVKDLQDRIQHLDSLASSAAALREECAAVVESLSDTPTRERSHFGS